VERSEKIVVLIWLPATCAAALLQAWRTAVQQRVRKDLSINAAGLVRYLYGFPVACLLLLMYMHFHVAAFPAFSPALFTNALAAGLLQLLATNLLIMSFGYRSYVVGTAYAKTEAIQGALLAMILLGEKLPVISWIGIAIGVVGVVHISTGNQGLRLRDMAKQISQPAALCGLGAGLLFALTAIFVKRASFAVQTTDHILAALIILVLVVFLQMLMQGLYVMLRERDQVVKIFRTWRVSGQVGVLAAIGSACWFTGFASAPVALVRAVGQIEVIFTLAFGHFYLREPLKRNEAIGLLLVAMGVVLALIGGLQLR
jgi:drug/metabolite transporter (DMT)-like permease